MTGPISGPRCKPHPVLSGPPITYKLCLGRVLFQCFMVQGGVWDTVTQHNYKDIWQELQDVKFPEKIVV